MKVYIFRVTSFVWIVMKGKVLLLIGEEFEDVEALYPYYRLIEEGYNVDAASYKKGSLVGKHGIGMNVSLSLDGVKPEEYVALVLPGGRGPERLRLYPKSVEIVRKFIAGEKVIAAICHGPQLLISAGAVRGKTLTCWPGIKDDIIAAGGNYLDKEVVIDGKLITSRKPDDLPYFMREMIKLLKK